jgi:Lrp/AsnC family transcriptional regulator for asnA, asnC and gidA
MSKKNKQTLKIDAVDSRIILLLQEDGRMSNKAIARELGIAESTVRTRLKRLIEDRIVKIVALSNPFDLGRTPSWRSWWLSRSSGMWP